MKSSKSVSPNFGNRTESLINKLEKAFSFERLEAQMLKDEVKANTRLIARLTDYNMALDA